MATYSKSQDTINRVLEVARTLSVPGSHAYVTIAETAAQVNISAGALHHRFASKHDICLQIIHRCLYDARANMQADGLAFVSSHQELIDAFQAFISELLEGVLRDRVANHEMRISDARLLSSLMVATVAVSHSQYSGLIIDGPEAIAESYAGLPIDGTPVRQGINDVEP